ncbi:aryl-sulfate sulfotransferase [Marinobacter hydrocarbonoclasticus]|nr:aryl-sulfate sulfotransferase [Marinobacter nauticus]
MLKRVVLAMAAMGIMGSAMAVSLPPAPAVGKLGSVVVDPYGTAPLTALIELAGKSISDVHVTVQGKGPKGVSIDYPVGRQSLLTHDGIPVFGLYANHLNSVVVSYTLDGQKVEETYSILTGGIQNRYIDNRSTSEMQPVEVKTVASGFEDRLYLVNSHTLLPQGSDLHWGALKDASSGLLDANPAGGSLPFDAVPMTYVIDTQGEYRWWLSQDAIYDGKRHDVDRRGYLMGINPTADGSYTFVQGQRWYEMDLLGRFAQQQKLPRGFIDASHESVETPQGTVLLRVAKRNYLRDDGQVVHTVRDHIIEVDKSGNLLDVWVLPEILDPLRDDLIKALDASAVCISRNVDAEGKEVVLEPDAPFGDAVGVGAGRNWAHVNSIAYDPSDDSIIVSPRHQASAIKIGRDKQVKWILSASIGWSGELADKLLTPVDANGKPLECTVKGVCEGGFDFSYTQHTAWISDKGTLTVFDNGDGRHYRQPFFKTERYSRAVEYKIDEQKGTVQQLWEYGKERGYDWFSPITSNAEYRSDRDTMFVFGGSIHLFDGSNIIGKINEIDYDTKAVKVEIDVISDKTNSPHYRALVVNPDQLFR